MNTPPFLVPLVVPRRPIAHTVATVKALADALRYEERLLNELVEVVRRQRNAVTRDDLDALDDSVFATHRILRTLGEARRQRRTLNHLLGEGDDLSLDALLAAFDGDAPDIVRVAIETLGAVATTLHREIDINRRVLTQAIDNGNQLVRALRGAPESSWGYSPAMTPPIGHNILDTSI